MAQKTRRQRREGEGGIAERGGIGEIKRRGEGICQGSFEEGQHARAVSRKARAVSRNLPGQFRGGQQAVVEEDEVLQNGA